jgi:ABC-type phosphate/phosphonate transport system substrate-binding protein
LPLPDWIFAWAPVRLPKAVAIAIGKPAGFRPVKRASGAQSRDLTEGELQMTFASISPRELSRKWCILALALVPLFGVLDRMACGRQAKKVDVLRIGTSGTLALDSSGAKEETAIDTLKSFIKSETGFDNEMITEKNYKELADKMFKGQLHLGVFQGYEFAWAQEKDPKLQPLAIAVNVYPYRYAYVVARRDNKATDFAGLQGQSLSLPRAGQGHLRLFVERQSQAAGKPLDAYFSKMPTPDNAEDALDDVVDGTVQTVVVDRVGLEAYKRRKPGRFSRLKVVAQSPAFPPPLVAYYGMVLDKATRERFQDGLLNANRKEEGKRLLTLFRLTGFEASPGDFEKVIAETRKAYPPPQNASK